MVLEWRGLSSRWSIYGPGHSTGLISGKSIESVKDVVQIVGLWRLFARPTSGWVLVRKTSWTREGERSSRLVFLCWGVLQMQVQLCLTPCSLAIRCTFRSTAVASRDYGAVVLIFGYLNPSVIPCPIFGALLGKSLYALIGRKHRI